MDAESFPDVTLANNSVTEHQALNSPNQNEGNYNKDTAVVLKSKRHRNQTSLTHLIFIAVTAIIFLVIAVVITFFVTKNNFCQSNREYPHRNESLVNQPVNSTTVPFAHSSTTPKMNNATLYPWSGIRLPNSVKPSLYELHLQIDLTKFTYQGSVNITVQIITSTKLIIFHRNEIDIDQSLVSISSPFYPKRMIVKQSHWIQNNFHILEMDSEMEAGQFYILSVGRFNGVLRNDLRGLYLSSYKNQEGQIRYLAVTQFQAMDARRAFPCFDEPNFKAKFKISITYQAGYTALTNMPATQTMVLNNGWLRTDYQMTPVMSTYLLAIVVSDFKSRNYTSDGGFELKIWARPDAYSQTEHAWEFSRKCYEFFTDYFATPEIVPKSDHVAVPDFSGGAMENWGLVVYREAALLYDSAVSSSMNKYIVTSVVAHEIAHTWFGNMVTMEWWDDLWLNEGFANLLMYVAMDHMYPLWNVFAIVIVDDILPVMVEDALTTSHPVSSKINNPEEINQRFDSISYNKGMAVLRMMMDFAGTENFKTGLRMYIDRYKFKNADMTQLWAVFSEAFNNSYEVAKIMDTWTRQMGYPVVSLEDKGDTFMLHQEVFLLDQSMHKIKSKEDNPFGRGQFGQMDKNVGSNISGVQMPRYKWYIPFTFVTHDSPTYKRTVWLNLGSASIPKPPTGWLLGNYEMVGFFKVKYDRNMWGLLAEQLMNNHTVIPEVNRAGLIGDAFALARANILDYDVAFNLTRYLKKEQSYIPWQAFQHSIDFIKAMIVTKEAYIELQIYIQDLVAPVFDIVGTADKGELPERYLRRVILTMACDIGIEKAVSFAKSMFVNWMKHGSRLQADQSMLIYSVGVREGDVDEWDYVWNKTLATEVTTESDMLLESLAQTQKPWLLWRYINWVFNKDKIRLQDVRSIVSTYAKNPLSRMIVLEFLLTRWRDIVKTFDVDAFLISEIITKTTMFVNTEFHLKQLEAVLKDNTPPTASSAADNAFAMIKANIGWMNDNYQEIADWLVTNTD